MIGLLPRYLDGLRRLHRHSVICGVPVGQAQIKVLDVQIEVGQDELRLDHGPDDPAEPRQQGWGGT